MLSLGAPLTAAATVVACTFPDYKFAPGASNVSAGLTSGGLTSTGGFGSGGFGGASGGDAGAGGADGGAGGATASTTGGTTAPGTSSGVVTTAGAGGGQTGAAQTSAGGTASGGTSSASTTSGSGGSGGELIDVGPCSNDQICLSAQCDAGNCRPAHCGNGETDENESDVDCGGPDCRGCAYRRECQQDSDCASGVCGTNSQCGPTLRVRCACNSQGACDTEPEQLNIDLQFENVGPEPLELNEFSIYYYYSHAPAADTARCSAVNLQSGSCDNLDLELLGNYSSDPSATRALRFRFATGVIPESTMSGAILVTIDGSGPYERDDDFSFLGVPTNSSNFVVCERVVVTDRYGVTLWGAPPAP